MLIEIISSSTLVDLSTIKNIRPGRYGTDCWDLWDGSDTPIHIYSTQKIKIIDSNQEPTEASYELIRKLWIGSHR